MSDYADGIVDRAMQHTLVLDDAGQPVLSHSAVVPGVVFAECSKGCNVSAGSSVLFEVTKAERRHQIYVAVTETTEHLRRVGQLGVPVPEAQNDIKLFGEEHLAMPKPKPGDPCPTCGTPMRRMADGSGECLSDHK